MISGVKEIYLFMLSGRRVVNSIEQHGNKIHVKHVVEWAALSGPPTPFIPGVKANFNMKALFYSEYSIHPKMERTAHINLG